MKNNKLYDLIVQQKVDLIGMNFLILGKSYGMMIGFVGM